MIKVDLRMDWELGNQQRLGLNLNPFRHPALRFSLALAPLLTCCGLVSVCFIAQPAAKLQDIGTFVCLLHRGPDT